MAIIPEFIPEFIVPIVVVVLKLVGLMFVVLAGLAVWAYVFAGYGIFFSFIKSGEIVLVEMGKSFYKLIPNIPGYGVLNDKIDLISNGAKKPKSFLGIFWIGIYPIQKVHKYSFSWDKFVSKNEAKTESEKGGTIEETYFGIISHRSEVVSSVRHKNSYPIILKEMELRGQLKIDIYFDIIFETVNPVFSVFMLNGNWFPLAVSAFSGIVSDFLKGMELRKTPKSIVGEKTFEETNKESDFNEAVLAKKGIILEASGMTVAQVVYRDYAQSGTTASKAAMEGLKIAELNAQTKQKEGEGEGAKTLEIKKAEALGIREVKGAEADMLLRALDVAKKHSQGGDILVAKEYAGAIKDFTGSTLIFGASNISPMIPIDGNKNKSDQKKEDKNV